MKKKYNKKLNIVLIITLIAMGLWSNLAYSEDIVSLRVPIEERTYTRILTEEAFNERLDDLEIVVAILDHGGPFINIGGLSGAIDFLFVDNKPSDKDFEGFYADVDRVSELYENIVATIKDRSNITREELQSFEEKIQSFLEQLEELYESIDTLVAGVSENDAIVWTVKRLLYNVGVLKGFIFPEHLEGLERIDLDAFFKSIVLETKWTDLVRWYGARPIDVEIRCERNIPSVEAPRKILHIALERLVSNAQSAILANFERRFGASENYGRLLHVKWGANENILGDTASETIDLNVIEYIDREGKKYARMVFQNPGKIDEARIPGLFTLDTERPDFSHGIGLVFAARVIHRLGGKISCENVTIDGQDMVKFTVDLPASDSSKSDQKLTSMRTVGETLKPEEGILLLKAKIEEIADKHQDDKTHGISIIIDGPHGIGKSTFVETIENVLEIPGGHTQQRNDKINALPKNIIVNQVFGIIGTRDQKLFFKSSKTQTIVTVYLADTDSLSDLNKKVIRNTDIIIDNRVGIRLPPPEMEELLMQGVSSQKYL